MIFVTADTHGEMERFEDKQLKKLKKGDTLVVLGDFGFVWTDSEKEKKNLAKLAKKPFTILFIDGLGDSFEVLGRYADCEYCSAKAKEIEQTAQAQATQLKATVTQYCDNLLTQTQEQLKKSFDEVKLVKDNLKK